MTICIEHRACLLGDLDLDTVELSATGQLVSGELQRIEERFPGVAIDAVVIMPNHLHAIIAITDSETTGNAAPTLGEILRAFKAASARVVRRDCDPGFGWQRNYFERVIRDDRELRVFRDYIETNPARWATDDLFTTR